MVTDVICCLMGFSTLQLLENCWLVSQLVSEKVNEVIPICIECLYFDWFPIIYCLCY